MNIEAWLRKIKLVLLVSRDVCRAGIKERMMYGFLLLALLFILMANVPFTVDDPRVLSGQTPQVAAVQIGFVAINIFVFLIAIFVSVNTLQNFLSRESLALLLSKPVQRWVIYEGVVLGLFEMVFLNWFLMTMGLWLVLISQTRAFCLYIWPGMFVTVLLGLMYVVLVTFFYVLIPNAVAGVLTVLVVIAGFGSTLAKETFMGMAGSSLVRWLFEFGLNILPPINALWGISMNELGLFDLTIRYAPILFQAVAIIIVVDLLGVHHFKRMCRT